MPSADNRLATCLQRAHWKPRDLGRAINAWLESRGRIGERIHPTTPYSWIKRGFCPYEPYPHIVADILSARLGEMVTPEDLWPDRMVMGPSLRPADDGLRPSWSVDDVARQMDELIDQGASRYVPTSGNQLVVPALDGFRGRPRSIGGLRTDRVEPPLMNLIVRHIADLRRLDDRAGGGALSLRYVSNELRAVLDLLRNAICRADVHDRLLLAAGDLAQLSGWMHCDAGEHGTGQRYLLLAIRAARTAADSLDSRVRVLAQESAANMLGMLAYQSAHAGRPDDALRLAEAAAASTRSARPATRARLAGRLATAHAAAGDVYGFRDNAETARRLLEKRSADDPDFLYYLNGDQLSAEAGQALVDLASRHSAERRKLLMEAIELLTPLTSSGLRNDYQRSALLHGCYLVQAHLHDHDLEAATNTTRTALSRLPEVQSGRCRTLLRGLRQAFARRARNPYVADLLPELDAALRTA